jgi:hypothetical protein
VRHVLPKHLDGDVATVLHVSSEVDDGHAAGADLAKPLVAAFRALSTRSHSGITAGFYADRFRYRDYIFREERLAGDIERPRR